MKNNNRLASVGVLLLLPAAALISSGVFRFNVPQILIYPFLVVGGVLGALALNLLAILRIGAERERTGAITAVTVRIGVKFVNLAVVAMSTLLMATIVGYLFVENFRPR